MQKLLRMMHKKEEGFTLVELMVVVVILGILVAIGMAMFGDLGDDAAVSANEANIRTIDGAVQLYRAGEGSYPTTVADIVGAGYLVENPDSPFDDTEEAYELDSGDPPRAQMTP